MDGEEPEGLISRLVSLAGIVVEFLSVGLCGSGGGGGGGGGAGYFWS